MRNFENSEPRTANIPCHPVFLTLGIKHNTRMDKQYKAHASMQAYDKAFSLRHSKTENCHFGYEFKHSTRLKLELGF